MSTFLRKPFAGLLIGAIVLVSALAGVFGGGSAAAANLPGDANCNSQVEVLDAMAILGYAAGSIQASECIASGDIDCSGTIDIIDALKVLRITVALEQAGGCSYIWPFTGPLTNPFNPPSHNGIDIDGCGKDGAPVVAAAAAKVKQVAVDPAGYGNYVVLEHQDGAQTLYAHLASVSVTANQVVARGDKIGGVGHTGYVIGQCGGTHLHFELKIKGSRVNPLLYL
ncbi:MAG TPA: peptidoglycan DD-metalloendopeptidase family protein, partial [Dehalococcoidia bacterium]|nr:peptidoglycan DD-metalloendopeptidase family protein [Dehalococcoidia bacterium]